MTASTFTTLLSSVRAADQDFEWYPTTPRMLHLISRYLDKSLSPASIFDIGAGDGRALTTLAAVFEHPPDLYAIEKSPILLEAQPESVIPVGTDLFEQNLSCLPVDYLFCNPPYSQFESWATLIIESGHARRAFLVLPQRWKDNPAIALALKKRGATARVIHTDDFHDAPRKARAVIDIVEVYYPVKDRSYGGRVEVQDPFDIWFDEHISTFDAADDEPQARSIGEEEVQALARVRLLTTITDLVAGYDEEYQRMQDNYRAIFKLDYALLKELGVSKDNVRDGIKKKMAGLKSKYWTILFERLTTITDRLSTATKAKFLERLVGRVTLAFTANNAYAIVIWSIKNANKYFNEQTIALYRDLSTFEGVLKYKSNLKTWVVNDWRYFARDEQHRRPSHYALDYRIVVNRYNAIANGDLRSWDFPNNLYKGCHELLADVVAVLFNLGFPSPGPSSLSRDWHAGEWQNWYRLDHPSTILFQAKAHKNGNLHFRFLPAAIRALNVEAGRLLGWLKAPADVVEELGYSHEEAERYYCSTALIAPASASRVLLLGDGSGSEASERQGTDIDR